MRIRFCIGKQGRPGAPCFRCRRFRAVWEGALLYAGTAFRLGTCLDYALLSQIC